MINKLNSAPMQLGFGAFSTWCKALRNAESPERTLRIYRKMQRLGVPSDSFAILFTLKSSTLLQNLCIIRHLHALIIKEGFSFHVYVATALLNAYAVSCFRGAYNLFDEIPTKNTVTWNTMMKAYSRCGYIDEAREVFDKMPLKDLASWSAIIAAYMNNRRWKEGLAIFREMVITVNDLKPDEITLGPVLAGCCHMGSIGLLLGKMLHGFAIRNEWEMNANFGTCLVDMYSKCGVLKNAFLIFNSMRDRNVVAWTSLICGAVNNGFGNEALEIFKKMNEARVRPNEVTFTGVLSACAQTALVEEGRRYFRMMKEEYGLTRSIQHYGCMVDLFGKAGLLEEAYEVINSMSFEPNVIIWGSFLSSCKLHKQFEMGDRVIERVMKTVKPENDGGVYSLISDIYVLSGRLGQSESVRELMLNDNVRKARGSSFIRS
ncbi:unnamed protein product [Cuscuta europaea]|uniref:Pentatricopeptide repeat-containing protein n=1 Tax=Cuscuta europaea TaxID=41803 RepID=A0A9P0ZNG0_CUSEU|nr:unnamed protein product [Cuscuta europaea]